MIITRNRHLFCTAAIIVSIASPAHAEFSADYCTNGRAIERRVSALRDELGLPSLTAAVFTSVGTIRQASAGVRNVETGAPVRLDDFYSVGSLTKTVTGLIAASLVDEGRLSFDSTLGELLPDYAAGMSEGFRSATLGQLLNHTSGAPAFSELEEFSTLFDLTASAADQRTALIQTILAEDPIFQPGSDELYSNVGLALAGIVAERVTGQTWETLVQERIAGPLALDLFSGIPLDRSADQPAGHVFDDGGALLPVTDPAELFGRVPLSISAAGSLSSSVGDWARLNQEQLRALQGLPSALPVSRASLEAVYTPSSPQGSFGYGTVFTTLGGEPVEFFVGSTGTFFAINALSVGRDAGLVLASNSQSIAISLAEGQLDAILLDFVAATGQGLTSPATADQKTVFAAVEAACNANAPRAQSIVALFGDLPADEARALARAAAPDDARIAARVAMAPLEVTARLLTSHTPAGDTGKWRFSTLYGESGGAAPVGAASENQPLDAKGRMAGLSSKVSVFSVEGAASPFVSAGAAFAYGESEGVLPGGRGGAEVASNMVAGRVRLGGDAGPYLDTVAVYADQKLKSRRLISTPTADFGTATASRRADSLLVETSAGYRFAATPALTITPFAGFRHEQADFDAAQETGSLAAFELAQQSFKALSLRAGASAAYNLTFGEWSVVPSGTISVSEGLDLDQSGQGARLDRTLPFETFAASRRNDNFVDYEFELAVSRGRFAASIGGLGVAGREGDDDLGWFARVRIGF